MYKLKISVSLVFFILMENISVILKTLIYCRVKIIVMMIRCPLKNVY